VKTVTQTWVTEGIVTAPGEGDMQVLVIGGTRFIGPHVVRRLLAAGHAVAVFHRGQTRADLPPAVVPIRGDRNDLPAFAGEFERLAPQVVIDMVAYTERDALDLVRTFRGLARRLVVLSSMDVYRSYERLRDGGAGVPDPTPAAEDAPLRRTLFPYRGLAKGEDDLLYHYEKILVERAVSGSPDLPATVLRLPAVYGPGDDQRRTVEYLKRMDDGRPAILLNEVRAGWRWSRGYVENAAAAVALATADERSAGRTYNVGEQDVCTEAEWVRRIGRAAGWAGEVLGLPEEALPPHLRAPYDWRHDCVGDTERIRRELGYGEPVGLEEALRRTVAWERAQPPRDVDPKQFDYAAEDAALAARGGA
jgi:nucleoside-diphosphate-sugar epimerase